MLDINDIRKRADEVRRGSKAKNVDVDIDAVLEADEKRRKLIQEVESKRAEQNEAGERIAAEKNADRKKALIGEMRSLKEAMVSSEKALKDAEGALEALLERVPNVPSEDTPVGKDESANVVLRTVGEPPAFPFEPRDHAELGEALGLIDNETASKVAGARFTYLKGGLVLLQNALQQYAFSVLTNEGILKDIIADRGLDAPSKPFVPVIPPLMLKPEVFRKMARLEPKEERYHVPSDDLYLLGSAEHTLGPMHMDAILKEEDLPIRYAASTPAFRREAGSYGKDTRGIIRLHQFDKVEMESFTVPEASRAEQDFFVAIQEHLVSGLGLPYRVVQICTGDMGGPDARQIDIECWMPGQGKYRETHTADLMTDYQARRLGTRVRRGSGEVEFVHMNDATALAMGRMLVAIMENGQEADGRIRVPNALLPYMNGRSHIG